MNKILTTTVIAALGTFLLNTPALAVVEVPHGIYAGINLGYGNMKDKISGSTVSKTSGFAGRADIGYKFNPHFGTEFGFSMFRDGRFSNGVNTTNNFVFDLALRATLPMKNGFMLFGKIGPALVSRSINDPNNVLVGTTSGNHMKPTIFGAAGAGYSFTKNISLNIQGAATAKNGRNIPMTYMLTGGLVYTIPVSDI